ncbi:phosphomannomutase/phosphoglucomutase [Legionella oakridgensis]|uniref:phosphomannomutase n=2 Tax=Legionella oakridgensis TaxID=29423 RepID=W0BC81_9GAMM|nr:phosphomannomutase/phosphoglucomutase [Legionella oakridgensis]AHE66271.1 phosphomannomutase [Legionella oakridgensis ATCC 33761 = DSM 21215]ETO93911.1 phosphomannomutase [Legionella oakridgensis RV-2-2007]KTD37215.1 phosphomannomutase [Legionella oakridgensis]STY16167.1 phosphomannomutase [Legionella longbeachae]
MMGKPAYRQKQVCRHVFRAYDIRGIIDEQLDANAFYSIGKAISCRLHALNRQQLFLARDGRLTSETLANALKQGLLDSGIDVFDLGAVPTPVMYYATHASTIDCGLMVTGSHNPANYNGIKMVLAGKTLANDDIEILYDLNKNLQSLSGQGVYQAYDILNEYINRIVSDIKLHRPFKVVVDCGNGIAGPIAPHILERLGCDVIPLYCEVDGRFPNHHPDPTVEANLRDLKEAVAAHHADIGLAFDGDADRLGVITNDGELIWPDRLLMLYAHDILSRNPGASIVYDVKCSSHLANVIEQNGGKAKMCPTGHSIVKAVMKQEHAALAGEMSGHIFFKDRWYGFDDALYSACRLLEILSQAPHTVSEQFFAIPNSINTPEIKIPIADDEKFMFMQRFSEHANFMGARLITIDGLRVEFNHGWGLIRASNTTPCLVARFEACDQAGLASIKALFKTQLHELDKDLEIPF